MRVIIIVNQYIILLTLLRWWLTLKLKIFASIIRDQLLLAGVDLCKLTMIDATHGNNTLDNFLTSRPELFAYHAVACYNKTKRKGLAVNDSSVIFFLK
jgi:hypothetical protein